jgi:hypothetical protein
MAAGMFAVAVPAVGNALTLSVPLIAQAKSNWCWVTSAQMVIEYLTGQHPLQCNLVKYALNRSDCPNETGSFYNVNRALIYGDVAPGTVYGGSPSYNDLVAEIGGSRPVIARWGWKSCDMKCGHMVVVRGYTSSVVYYLNPLNGGSYGTASHSYFANNSSYTTTHNQRGIRAY